MTKAELVERLEHEAKHFGCGLSAAAAAALRSADAEIGKLKDWHECAEQECADAQERHTELVAENLELRADLARAVEEEREACAQEVDGAPAVATRAMIAAAIRARTSSGERDGPDGDDYADRAEWKARGRR